MASPIDRLIQCESARFIRFSLLDRRVVDLSLAFSGEADRQSDLIGAEKVGPKSVYLAGTSTVRHEPSMMVHFI